MTRLQDWFVRAGAAHGLRVDLDVAIPLTAGRVVRAPIHLHGVGALRGMVIATRWEDLKGSADELVAAGFGYSVMGEPAPGGEVPGSFQDLLDDWGITENEDSPAPTGRPSG